MATLSLLTVDHAQPDIPFPAGVQISGAAAGTTVTVNLRQTRGVAPFFNAQASAVIAADGSGGATFDVKLAGQAGDTVFAVLVASASDANNGFFAADAHAVLVP
jgi:hypothetical protein